ncbi:MAG: hypothetical protein RLZZ127_1678, partial [Planctomycetota bacterium]
MNRRRSRPFYETPMHLSRSLLCASLLLAPAAAADHPFLLADAPTLARIRAAAAQPGHHREVLAALRQSCDRLGEAIIAGRDRTMTNWAYDRAFLAVRAATVHAVTGEARYADLALRSLESITADPDPDGRTMLKGYGLSRSTVVVGYALAWDLAAAAWPAERRAKILATMQEAAVAWNEAGHINISGDFHSNWTSVMRGAEILLRLSLQEPDSPRMQRITDELTRHFQSHGSAGWSQEGPVYLGYSMAFGVPAALALERAGKPGAADAWRARGSWKLAMHTGMFTAAQHAPSFGVGGPYYDERGWLSLQPLLMPAADRPGYLWFYDRFRGIANPAPAEGKFDHRGWGQAFALLGYPVGVAPTDPTGAVPAVLADDHGGAFWRPRWHDAGDPIVGLISDGKSSQRAWNQADAGNLVLLAHGSVFAVGAGSSTSKGDDMSRLTVAGAGAPGTTLTGTLMYADGDAQAFRAGVGYGGLSAGAGMPRVDRHLGAAPAGDDTVLLVVDDYALREPRRLAWCLNQMDGIAGAEAIETAGRTGFLVRGSQGGWLIGWLISPAGGAEVKPRDPLQVSWQATGDGTAVVALAMGSGPWPLPASLPDAPGGEVRLAGRSLRWDAATKRVVIAPDQAARPDFTVSATTGPAPLTLAVRAAAGSTDVRWSVDGKPAGAGPAATLTLTSGGPVRVRMDSSLGACETIVQVLNRDPVAAIAVDRASGPAPLAVRFDAGASRDPDGHALTFRWTFPDGGTADGPVTTRTFDGKQSAVSVGLTVRDAHGGRGDTVQRILVGNQAPVVQAGATPERGAPPLRVRLDASASRDPEGKPLRIEWRIPALGTRSGAQVEVELPAGEHRILCTATDPEGASGSQELLVDAANQPPSIAVGEDLPEYNPRRDPDEGARRIWGVVPPKGDAVLVRPLVPPPFTAALRARTADADGDAVTVAWDFGDGTNASGERVQHTWSKPGRYQVVATATDARGGTARASWPVEIDGPRGRLPDGPAQTVPGLSWRHAFAIIPTKWPGGVRPTSVPADAPRPPPAGASSPVRLPLPEEGLHNYLRVFDTFQIQAEGVIALPNPVRTARRADQWVTEYAGFIEAPATGTYRFALRGKSAAQLWIGSRLVVMSPDDYRKIEAEGTGTIALEQGLHSIRLLHGWYQYNSLAPELVPRLELRWQPPGANAVSSVPAERLRRAPSKPVATIAFSDPTPVPGQRVRLSALESQPGAGARIAEVAWDFGDGASATGMETAHAWTAPGEYRVTARLRSDQGGTAVAVQRVLVGERMPAITAGRILHGLNYRYYGFDDTIKRMPDFAALEPDAIGTVLEPDIGDAAQGDNFAFDFTGFLHVPKDGVYRFMLDSDDGGILSLDGRVAVDNSLITPTVQSETGDVGLQAGLHRMRIEFFEGVLAQRLNLLVQEPGETRWKPVPADWYWRDAGASLDAPPTAAIALPKQVQAGQLVLLDATASQDPDGDPLAIRWNYGDGEVGSGPQVSHAWRTP